MKGTFILNYLKKKKKKAWAGSRRSNPISVRYLLPQAAPVVLGLLCIPYVLDYQ